MEGVAEEEELEEDVESEEESVAGLRSRWREGRLGSIWHRGGGKADEGGAGCECRGQEAYEARVERRWRRVVAANSRGGCMSGEAAREGEGVGLCVDGVGDMDGVVVGRLVVGRARRLTLTG